MNIQRHVLVNALHCAADVYKKCAEDAERDFFPGLVTQFKLQETEARAMIDVFEEGEKFTLVD